MSKKIKIPKPKPVNLSPWEEKDPKWFKYDIDVFFQKRKGGKLVKQKIMTVAVKGTSRKRIKQEMTKAIEKERSRGRYHDWQILGNNDE